jgi:dolichol-phosphate mannosyltransferase
MKVSVILPTYNEKGNIIRLIQSIDTSLLKTTHEIIIVDDNSPDKTADAVSKKFKNDKTVKVFVRKTERGLATAILYGIERVEGDIIVVMDTDFQHDPTLIPRMVDLCSYYDLVIGSRFVRGGGMQEGYRYYFSYLFNFFVRLALRMQIQDNLSGFFAIRSKKLKTLKLNKIFIGYGDYFIRLLHASGRARYSILEIPVFYHVRPYGQSKSSFLRMIKNYSQTVLSLLK